MFYITIDRAMFSNIRDTAVAYADREKRRSENEYRTYRARF